MPRNARLPLLWRSLTDRTSMKESRYEHPCCVDYRRADWNPAAAAIAFAQEGNRIVVSGRHDDAGEALVCELRALGTEAEFIRADVRHEDDVRDLVDRTVTRFGRLDAAANCAGTEGQPGP